MSLVDLWRRSELAVFGFVMGSAATVLAILLWHQARGFVHISAWQRAVEKQNLG